MKKLVIALAAVAMLAPGFAGAETIYLRSGSRLSGMVVEDKAEGVKVAVTSDNGNTAILTIAREKIDRVEKVGTFDERLKVAQGVLDDDDGPDAEPRFRELVRENPRHGGARIGLAKSLVNLGRETEAFKTMEHYVALTTDKRDPRALLYYAELLLQRGDHRDARKWTKEAGAQDPGNAKLKEQVDAQMKRIERVRDGADIADQKAAALKAEVEKRVKERAAFDRATGTNLDASQAGKALAEWTNGAGAQVVESTVITLEAADRAEGNFARGVESAEYQKFVENVSVVVQVTEAAWTKLYDHQKRQQIYGWFYQLRARYPNAVPRITVQKTEKDKRGQPVVTELARGTWDGRKEEIVVDMWTAANVDPTRPRTRPR
ncbi:MAG: hypothetical protein IT462_00125 [Planctomycetes bacterium]|nr:hypothetical protein [Planctomycetota bacterium]